MVLEDHKANAISAALLDLEATLTPAELIPTLEEEASKLVASDPYAFCVAACLDRGARVEMIWTLPYYMKMSLGHLEPRIIYNMSLEDLAALFARLPKRPRYINASPTTTRDLTRLVVEQFGGDASRIWRGRTAAEAKRTFMSIYGVGAGIASMFVLLVERTLREHFPDLDRPHMDIKADTHTVRVLWRLGVSEARTEEGALRAARQLNPEFPGGIDAPLWVIGRRWCSAISPRCPSCAMNELCPKRLGGTT